MLSRRVMVAIFVFVPSVASAGALIPSPTEPTFDAALSEKADGFVRQLHGLLTLPIGFGLNAIVSSPENRALIDGFFATDERDFRAATGKHPFEVIDEYNDYSHAGIFGGVQMAGDAFRYAVLRDEGADPSAVREARRIFLRNLEVLDWYTRVTGTPGAVARGIRRITSDPGEPPIPGIPPETKPMTDGDGNPNPKRKTPTWRVDRSGELPFLIWLDDASRDTFDGYVFALGASYDVGKNDPNVPQALIDRLVRHARDIGRRLIETTELPNGSEIDMVLRDADERPVTYHAFSAEEVLEGVVGVEGASGFNAVMGLGLLRTLLHVSGDQEIGRHYRNELIARRDFLGVMQRTLKRTLYFDEITNYSQVNMVFLAVYGLLRYEANPDIARRARQILETEIYDAQVNRAARGLKQSLFDFMFAGFRENGVTGIGAQAVADGIETLLDHRAAPYWDDRVINCDPQEVESLDCELVDGTHVRLASRRGYGGEKVVAVDPLPMRVRPPSDYSWRSDPHSVNGGGQTRINSGGDFHTAYWLGRFLKASDSGYDNISPFAFDQPVLPEEEGCSCAARRSPLGSAGLIAFWAGLLCLVHLRSRLR